MIQNNASNNAQKAEHQKLFESGKAIWNKHFGDAQVSVLAETKARLLKIYEEYTTKTMVNYNYDVEETGKLNLMGEFDTAMGIAVAWEALCTNNESDEFMINLGEIIGCKTLSDKFNCAKTLYYILSEDLDRINAEQYKWWVEKAEKNGELN